MSENHPKIVIVHYHLRRGGVTQVIETACRVLTANGVPVVVLSGEPPESDFQAASVHVIPDLGYREAVDFNPAALRSLIQKATDTAARALNGQPDLWHFHNASLGKNPGVTQMVGALAHDGVPVLSQIHDFAEDQRPINWKALVDQVGNGDMAVLDDRLYPVGPHCRIAVLSERDQRILLQAGAPKDTVLLLPNPITAPVDDMSREPSPHSDNGRQWVYPTRAIRRKNLGEFILWSAVAHPGDRFATTLEPTNPRDSAVYRAWIKLAQSLKLPIRFGVGLEGETAFRNIMSQATALATTSIAEGFGLAFLEPWLLDKPVVGRRLPEITADMQATGVDLSALYSRLDVPLEWIGRKKLRQSLDAGLCRLFKEYGVELPVDSAERAMAAIVNDECVDFGGLDETMQQTVIKRVAGSPRDAQTLQPHSLMGTPVSANIIERNRRLVTDNYSAAAYGRRLQELYAGLLDKSGDLSYIPASKVLTQFLQPERFRLLRMG